MTSINQFPIKCQCSVFKQNLQLNNNKKSKFSILLLDLNQKILKILPYQPTANRNQTNNQNQRDKQKDNNKNNSINNQPKIQLQIRKLRMIHKKFIEEGKITLQFIDSYQNKVVRGIDVSVQDKKQEIIVSVLISNASKENLELFIQKLMQIKLKLKQEDEAKQKALKQVQRKKINSMNIKKKVQQKDQRKESQETPNRTRFPTKSKGRQNSPPKMSRKQMIQQATQPQKYKPKKKVQQQQKPKNTIKLFDLPSSLLNQIFQYIEINLKMRLVSKQFSYFALKNIKSLKFKDQVDEQTFNKLASFAINIQCRMKNIRNISLYDKHDDQFLIKDKAKTLKFGAWKEMSFKNIQQIKHLRIYCLQIPYSIKFDFTYLFGLRLVQLKLKGEYIQTRNFNVKDQDVLKFIKISKTLTSIEIAFASTQLLLGIAQQQKLRIKQLKIGVLSIVSDDFSWTDFDKYPKLQKFGISKVMKEGIPAKLNFSLKLPENLTHCEIGQYLSYSSFENLPKNIKYLKINGDKFTSNHLQNVLNINQLYLQLPLTQIKQLDISECTAIGSQGLMNLQNTLVITNWQKQTAKSCQQRFVMRDIKVITIKYM